MIDLSFLSYRGLVRPWLDTLAYLPCNFFLSYIFWLTFTYLHHQASSRTSQGTHVASATSVLYGLRRSVHRGEKIGPDLVGTYLISIFFFCSSEWQWPASILWPSMQKLGIVGQKSISRRHPQWAGDTKQSSTRPKLSIELWPATFLRSISRLTTGQSMLAPARLHQQQQPTGLHGCTYGPWAMQRQPSSQGRAIEIAWASWWLVSDIQTPPWLLVVQTTENDCPKADCYH